MSSGNEARPAGGQKALIENPSAQVKFCLTDVYVKIKWNTRSLLIEFLIIQTSEDIPKVRKYYGARQSLSLN